MKTTTGGGEGG